jgi:dTDP-4-amino-4,6-dideoxygalactose transaminase
MRIPFLDLQAQYRSLKPEIDAAMQRVLDESSYVLGPAVEAFEKAFAAYCEADHCVGVNSGTSALALLMQAHGIGPGDEVITVANSFFASAEAISEIGATPVLVDCRVDDGLMDASLIGAAITERTKAIIPVHLYGQCADMDAINAVAKTRRLLVLEDACQAHGALYKGKKAGLPTGALAKAGSLGDGAAFSFYPGKNLGAYGEAGAVTTNTPAIAEKIRMLRAHGSAVRYTHQMIGWNERMDGLQGAVLGVKLKHLDTWNARRRSHAQTYRSMLPDTVTMMTEQNYGESAYHLLVIRSPHRDSLRTHLADKGIEALIHYPIPIHLQPAYLNRWKQGDFPVSEKLAGEILSLPLYPELTEQHIADVCEAIKEFKA